MLPLLAACGIGVWALIAFWPADNQELPSRTGKSVTSKGKFAKKGKRLGKAVRLQERANPKGFSKDAEEKKKPTFTLDDDDEANLNEEQRKLIQAIRDALDDNDKKTVLKLVRKPL